MVQRGAARFGGTRRQLHDAPRAESALSADASLLNHAIDSLIVGFDRALRTLSGTATAARPTPGGDLPESDARAARAPARGRPHAREPHREKCARRRSTRRRRSSRAIPRSRRASRTPRARKKITSRGRRRGSPSSTTRPSLLNPLWYAGSFAIGVAAGVAGDRANLGFVVETERQVEEHLTGAHRPTARRRREEPRDRRADARRRSAPRRDGPGGGRIAAAVSGARAMRAGGGRDAGASPTASDGASRPQRREPRRIAQRSVRDARRRARTLRDAPSGCRADRRDGERACIRRSCTTAQRVAQHVRPASIDRGCAAGAPRGCRASGAAT